MEKPHASNSNPESSSKKRTKKRKEKKKKKKKSLIIKSLGDSTIAESTIGDSTIDESTIGDSTIGDSTIGVSTIGMSESLSSKPKSRLKITLKTVANIKTTSEKLETCNDPIIYDPSFNERINMDKPNDAWVMDDKRVFPEFIDRFTIKVDTDERHPHKLWNVKNNSYSNIQAYRHQKFVSDYLNDNSPYRGLLLYHGLGSGKSGASITIAEGYRGKRVVVMLPYSLKQNYEDEIATFGDIAYRKSYHWCFIPLDYKSKKNPANDAHNKEIYDIMSGKGLEKTLLQKIITKRATKRAKKNYGVWLIDITKDEPNYSSLSSEHRNEIDKQIKKLYNYKYSFVHYNAGAYVLPQIFKLISTYDVIKASIFGNSTEDSKLTNKDKDTILEHIYNPENEVENPFNNKVIIIDEIHNLSSMMIGNGYNGPRIYELLMRATNCNLILLSGTPMINSAYELGIIANILRGFVNSIVFKVINLNSTDLINLKNKLKSNIHINRFEIKNGNEIEIVRNTKGFINKYNSSSGKKIGIVKNNDIKYISDEELIKSLNPASDDLDTDVAPEFVVEGGISHKRYNMFPDGLNQTGDSNIWLKKQQMIDAEEIFNNRYVDYDNFCIKNSSREDFQNRLVGLISHYNEISGKDRETNSELFPRIIYAKSDETYVELSDYQFREYSKLRDIERELEIRKKISKEGSGKDASYFRVYSRQSGIFVFPPNITRPLAKDFRDENKKKQSLSKRSDEDNQNKKDLINHLNEICNTEDDSKKRNLITNFVDELRKTNKNSLEKKDIFEQMLKNTPGIESDATLEQNIQILCESGVLDNNFDGDLEDLQPEITYKIACEQAIGKLSEENMTLNEGRYNLSILSPKFVKILENISKTEGLVFCYSQFRSVEGIEIFSRILNANGYERINVMKGTSELRMNPEIRVGSMIRFSLNPDESDTEWRTSKVVKILPNGNFNISNPNNISEVIEKEYTREELYKCNYALWTGSENVDQRKAIKNYFNSRENMYGKNCLILLATASGAEGISLMNVRQVHIMESYWNNIRTEQVIGRARRIKSHIYLQKHQQNVKVFKYDITFSEEQLNGTWGQGMDLKHINYDTVDEDEDEKTSDRKLELFNTEKKEISNTIVTKDGSKTSDEALVKLSDKKSRILSSFLNIIKKTAVDCTFNLLDNQKSLLNGDEYMEDNFCYTKIPDNDTGEYNFKLEDSYTVDASNVSGIREEVVNVKAIKIRLTNGKSIQLIVFIPAEFKTISDYLKIESNISLYNYYTYYNLDFTKDTVLKMKSLAGEIIDRKVTYNDEFSKNLDNYYKIEECIQESGITVPPSDLKSLMNWIKDVKDCHEERLKPLKDTITTWKCDICDDQDDLSVSVKTCPICEISTLELFLEFNENISKSSLTSDVDDRGHVGARGHWGTKS